MAFKRKASRLIALAVLPSLLLACGDTGERVPIKTRDANKGRSTTKSINWSKTKASKEKGGCLDLDGLLRELQSRGAADIQFHTQGLLTRAAKANADGNAKILEDKTQSEFLREYGLLIDSGSFAQVQKHWTFLNLRQRGCHSVVWTPTKQSEQNRANVGLDKTFEIVDSSAEYLSLENKDATQRVDIQVFPNRDKVQFKHFYFQPQTCNPDEPMLVELVYQLSWGERLQQGLELNEGFLRLLAEEVSFSSEIKDKIENSDERDRLSRENLITIPYSSFLAAEDALATREGDICLKAKTQEQPENPSEQPQEESDEESTKDSGTQEDPKKDDDKPQEPEVIST